MKFLRNRSILNTTKEANTNGGQEPRDVPVRWTTYIYLLISPLFSSSQATSLHVGEVVFLFEKFV